MEALKTQSLIEVELWWMATRTLGDNLRQTLIVSTLSKTDPIMRCKIDKLYNVFMKYQLNISMKLFIPIKPMQSQGALANCRVGLGGQAQF